MAASGYRDSVADSAPIAHPDRWVKAMRTSPDGVEHVAHVGYISGSEPDGKGGVRVHTSGSEGLLAQRPLPFPAPMALTQPEPEAFYFNWRSLDYVFGLADPATFGRLAAPLSVEDQRVVDRYVRCAQDLAASAVVNTAGGGMNVDIADSGTGEDLTTAFPQRDRQIGFSTLLRQCDSPSEQAPFKRVTDILWQASRASQDGGSGDAREQIIASWRRASGRLHARSLNQLVREKLAREEHLEILNYEEEHAPSFLLSAFQYGDLIHWDEKRSVLEVWDQDKYTASHRRLAFLAAAVAIAHVYIGFAVLAETATTTD